MDTRRQPRTEFGLRTSSLIWTSLLSQPSSRKKSSPSRVSASQARGVEPRHPDLYRPSPQEGGAHSRYRPVLQLCWAQGGGLTSCATSTSFLRAGSQSIPHPSDSQPALLEGFALRSSKSFLEGFALRSSKSLNQSTAHTVIMVVLLLLPLFLPPLSRLLQLVLLFLGDAPTVLSTTISLSCFLPLLDPTTPQIPLLVLHLAIETTTIATMTTPASASSLLPVRPPPSSSLLLLLLPLLIPFLLTPIILFLPLSYHGSFYCYCYCSHSLLQNFPSLIIRNLEPILTNNSKKF